MHQVVSFGLTIPPDVPHSIISSLPSWSDNERPIVNSLVDGYPRLTIPRSVLKLGNTCGQMFDKNCLCLPYPNRRFAAETVSFLKRVKDVLATQEVYTISESPLIKVHLVLYPNTPEADEGARTCWLYTGFGISSRFAEYCLALMNGELGTEPQPSSCLDIVADLVNADPRIYEDSQEGRRLALAYGTSAKSAIRERIVNMHQKDGGYARLDTSDVWLFPGGMHTNWHAHNLTMSVAPGKKAILFGFPYVSTLRILENWGAGCLFFPDASHIDQLEKEVEREYMQNSDVPPFTSLFTEFPSNPLLRTVDIKRLTALGDKYGFPIVIDDTAATSENVDILEHVDIVVTSLTKLFSGAANVMGGSLILNPYKKYYATFKKQLESSYEDTYFAQDAVVMEWNSRMFRSRVAITNANAEMICDYLLSCSVAGGVTDSVLVDTWYPKYTDRQMYDVCRRPGGGFGCLFNLSFIDVDAAAAFYNALQVHKGPSFGTTFTLSTAFAFLVFYYEREWAAEQGLHFEQVRISAGTEDITVLLNIVKDALQEAQAQAR